MAGEPEQTESVFLPAPVDGIDAVSPPTELALTTARQLDNYYCFDWGIRHRTKGTLQFTFGNALPQQVALIVPFIRLDGANAGSDGMIVASQRKLWRFENAADTTPDDITGSATVTVDFTHYAIFRGEIFFFNGVNPPVKFPIATLGSVVGIGYTGPASMNVLLQPVSYKSRLYVTEKLTSKFWYGNVEAIAGAMVAFDAGQVFQRGGIISVITTFSLNQGVGSDEFFVIISNFGEVLVYSGDYPNATNWQLVGRTNIPAPISTRSHIRIAQDVYVYTMRGIIALTRVFAGETDDRYYIISNKLGPHMIGDPTLSATIPGYNVNYPFLYFVGDSGKSLYVMNYERGAWSRFTYQQSAIPILSVQTISAVGVAFGSLWVGTRDSENKLYRFDDFMESAAPAVEPGVWKTPYMGFGTGYEKTSRLVRMLARDVSSNASAMIRTKVTIAADFKNTDTPGGPGGYVNHDVVTTPKPPAIEGHSASPPDWVIQELAPSGVGRNLSFIFLGESPSGQTELAGAEVTFSVGGVY